MAGAVNLIDDLDDMEVLDEDQTEINEIINIKTDRSIDVDGFVTEEVGSVVLDNIGIYIKEIGKYPLLSKEDERAAADKYKNHGDEESGTKLINSNLKLVIYCATKFRNKHKFMNLQDLIQEGNIGLILALRKFDPDKGYKFSYYATFWIKACIIKFTMDNYSLVKIGTTQAQRRLFFNLRKEKNQLEKIGINPTIELLSDNLDEKPKDVTNMLQRLEFSDVSMESEYGMYSSPFHYTVPSTGENADKLLEKFQVANIVREKINKFKKRLNIHEISILDKRILCDDPMTLQKIGDSLNLTKERIRQIEAKLKIKIRDYLILELGRDNEILKVA